MLYNVVLVISIFSFNFIYVRFFDNNFALFVLQRLPIVPSDGSISRTREVCLP